MKIIILFLASAFALIDLARACENLSGTWSCQLGGGEPQRVVIDIKKENDVLIANPTESFFANGKPLSLTIDGKNHEFDANDPDLLKAQYNATCTTSDITRLDVLIDLLSVDNLVFSLGTRFSLKDPNTLELFYISRSDKPDEVAVEEPGFPCTRAN